MAWTPNGPVSLPPPSAVYVVAIVVAFVGVASLGFGFRAAWRDGRPGFASDQTTVVDTALPARPVVVIPALTPPPAAANAAEAKADDSSDEDDSNSIAQKSAAAQAAQSQTANGPANIDKYLASPSEKPPPPVKPTTDEAPPAKSDVPF